MIELFDDSQCFTYSMPRRSLFRLLLLLQLLPLLTPARGDDAYGNYNDDERDVQRDLAATNFLQPKVTKIERSKVVGSISMAEGSPWCGGLNASSSSSPMFWLIGHQTPESPWCFDRTSSSWRINHDVKLQNSVDRHDCLTLDVDGDGISDILCEVGAKKGRGMGLNELCK